jgi:hypothetical protein
LPIGGYRIVPSIAKTQVGVAGAGPLGLTLLFYNSAGFGLCRRGSFDSMVTRAYDSLNNFGL